MKLAILSDTHGLLRSEVRKHLKTVDAILHGGDINKQAIVNQLQQYAPLYIVRGNNDKEWAEDLPHDLTVTLEGVTFFLVHNRKESARHATRPSSWIILPPFIFSRKEKRIQAARHNTEKEKTS